MPSRDEYRQRAMDCVATAETTRDPLERAAMLEIARACLKMAEHIRGRQHNGTAHRDQTEPRLGNDS